MIVKLGSGSLMYTFWRKAWGYELFTSLSSDLLILDMPTKVIKQNIEPRSRKKLWSNLCLEIVEKLGPHFPNLYVLETRSRLWFFSQFGKKLNDWTYRRRSMLGTNQTKQRSMWYEHRSLIIETSLDNNTGDSIIPIIPSDVERER